MPAVDPYPRSKNQHKTNNKRNIITGNRNNMRQSGRIEIFTNNIKDSAKESIDNKIDETVNSAKDSAANAVQNEIDNQTNQIVLVFEFHIQKIPHRDMHTQDTAALSSKASLLSYQYL